MHFREWMSSLLSLPRPGHAHWLQGMHVARGRHVRCTLGLNESVDVVITSMASLLVRGGGCLSAIIAHDVDTLWSTHHAVVTVASRLGTGTILGNSCVTDVKSC